MSSTRARSALQIALASVAMPTLVAAETRFSQRAREYPREHCLEYLAEWVDTTAAMTVTLDSGMKLNCLFREVVADTLYVNPLYAPSGAEYSAIARGRIESLGFQTRPRHRFGWTLLGGVVGYTVGGLIVGVTMHIAYPEERGLGVAAGALVGAAIGTLIGVERGYSYPARHPAYLTIGCDEPPAMSDGQLPKSEKFEERR